MYSFGLHFQTGCCRKLTQFSGAVTGFLSSLAKGSVFKNRLTEAVTPFCSVTSLFCHLQVPGVLQWLATHRDVRRCCGSIHTKILHGGMAAKQIWPLPLSHHPPSQKYCGIRLKQNPEKPRGSTALLPNPFFGYFFNWSCFLCCAYTRMQGTDPGAEGKADLT